MDSWAHNETEYSTSVARKGDMGEGMALTLHKQLDGDVILQIHPDTHLGAMESIEFCNSGGRSHHTTMALNALFEAMKKDQEAYPQDLPINRLNSCPEVEKQDG